MDDQSLQGSPTVSASAEITNNVRRSILPFCTAAQSMREIPQWHCLRYFKHDIHLMRRCRNYRMHMLRRPNDMM
ncbi:uncharacterized protein LOC118461556 isoform X2 [Anopheles albimanus]|uniref:uncharacterized protein LOC118461556 isoform X2 n=1 Tax=Anopheles albimanus TaxID=7167 RepID=UPI00163F223B|nr:uncharacterized protein LOC118461556 isoform X2 [Anopheles albimanus]